MSHEGSKGRFYPLGVLKTWGYDIDRIQNNTPPEHTYFDNQLGLCYRINLKFDDYCHSRGKQQDDTVTASDAPASQSTDIAKELSHTLNTIKRSSHTNEAVRKKRKAAKEKEIKALKKVNLGVKLHKCPEEFLKNNPLEKLITALNCIDEDAADFDDQLEKLHAVATPTIKAMKAFN